MTTPAYVNSPHRVITMGYRNAGYLERGQDPDSEMLAEGMVRLNDMVNVWQTQGIKLWLQFDLSIPLVQGTNLYTIGPAGTVVMTRPSRVLPEGYFRDQNSIDRPLFGISRNEWDTLSLKTGGASQQGTVVNFFVDKQVASMNVYFWQTPNANAALGTAHVLIQQQQTNVVGLTDTMVFPIEWFMALHWGFANEVSTGQPPAIVARCGAMAKLYHDALEDWDVEDPSMMLQPDPRTQYIGNRFV
jgi:hypothetical protein